MRRALALLLALVALTLAPRARAASADVKVLLPDDDNLQYMSFWLARAAGYFDDEGLRVSLVVPKNPQETRAYFERGEAYVAVLPPPVYLELVAERQPIVLVANLLASDPINLVVSDDAWNARHLTRDVPVAERLRAIRGLRVGVAPHPPTRLRAMFAAYGLDADRDVTMTIIHGRDQNDAFARGEVDALFAHTPYVEKALVDQRAHLLVHLSGGEVPQLAARQVHALVFARRFAEDSPDTAAAMTRAIARAETLVHASPDAAVAALSRAFPAKDPRQMRTIVELYAPAIPATPAVSADGFASALALFPAGRPAPSLAGIDLNAYVAPSFARDASRPRGPRLAMLFPLLLPAAIVAVVFALLRARRRARRV